MKMFELTRRNEYHAYHHARYKELSLDMFGIHIFDWWNRKDDNWSNGVRGAQYVRLCLFHMVGFGLFTGRCNYLRGRGWEFTTMSYRRLPTQWLKNKFNWSFGRSDSEDDGLQTIVRWRGWAFSHHDWKPVMPLLPEDPQEYDGQWADEMAEEMERENSEHEMEQKYDRFLHNEPEE